jgi:MFS family permease
MGKRSIGFRGLPATVVWLGIVSFFNDFSGEIVARALPLYLVGTLGITLTLVGVIEGVADFTSSILKIFSGWYSDKTGKRKLITVVGYALTAVARPILYGVTGWIVPLISRFTDRAGKGIRTSARDALIADSVENTNRGKAFGFQRALDPFGAVVGSLVAAAAIYYFQGEDISGASKVVLSSSTFNTLILISTFPTIIGVLLIIFFVKQRSVRTLENKIVLGAVKSLLSNHRFRYFLITIFIFTLGQSSDAFLVLRSQALGIGPATIFLIFAMLNMVTTVSSYPFGSFSDRYSRRKIIRAAWLLYALVYIGFAFATESWHAWGLFVAYGIFYGMTEGVQKALVADLVPEQQRGTAYGLFNATIGFAVLPASIIAGALWQMFDHQTAFLYGAALAVVGSVMLSFVRFPHAK